MTGGFRVGLVALVALACVTVADQRALQEPEYVLKALALEPGAHVADLFPGNRNVMDQLSEAVGPQGVVYVVEIDPDRLASLRERARQAVRGNIVVVEGVPDDPRLPDASVDVALLLEAYERIERRDLYFEHLRGALRPGGRVEILSVAPNRVADNIVGELAAFGYTLVGKRDLFDWWHMDPRSVLVFTPSP